MEEKICAIIAKALDVDAEKVTAQTLAKDLPEWDSLGHLTILMELAHEFGAELNGNSKLASVVSVGEIIDIVSEMKVQ